MHGVHADSCARGQCPTAGGCIRFCAPCWRPAPTSGRSPAVGWFASAGLQIRRLTVGWRAVGSNASTRSRVLAILADFLPLSDASQADDGQGRELVLLIQRHLLSEDAASQYGLREKSPCVNLCGGGLLVEEIDRAVSCFDDVSFEADR